jgi:hypothetical protein
VQVGSFLTHYCNNLLAHEFIIQVHEGHEGSGHCGAASSGDPPLGTLCAAWTAAAFLTRSNGVNDPAQTTFFWFAGGSPDQATVRENCLASGHVFTS